jgi:hypothetical protein
MDELLRRLAMIVLGLVAVFSIIGLISVAVSN